MTAPVGVVIASETSRSLPRRNASPAISGEPPSSAGTESRENGGNVFGVSLRLERKEESASLVFAFESKIARERSLAALAASLRARSSFNAASTCGRTAAKSAVGSEGGVTFGVAGFAGSAGFGKREGFA